MCTASDEPLPMIEQIRQAFDHLDSLEDTLEGLDDDLIQQQHMQNLNSLRGFFIRELSRRERELLMRLKQDESI
jgi:hypothetical protein